MSIDWTSTVLGTLCFLMLAHLMKKGGGGKGLVFGKGGGGKGTASWFFKSFLALMGGVFLAFSIVGVIARGGLSFLPPIVIGGAMVFALFVALVDIVKDRNADKPAVIALAVFPLLVLAAVGPIAAPGQDAVTSVYHGTTNTVGPWLGG